MVIEIFRDQCDPNCACYDTLNREDVLEAWFTNVAGELTKSTHRREFVRQSYRTKLPTDEEIKAMPEVAELAAMPGDVYVFVSYSFQPTAPKTKRRKSSSQGLTQWGLLIVRYPTREVSPDADRP